MSKPKVYIDGKEGTTGLQIYERLGGREDIELLLIDEDKRKDTEERKKFLNAADLVFLCLPDAAAVEAVSLIETLRPELLTLPPPTGRRRAGYMALPNCCPASASASSSPPEWPTQGVTPLAFCPRWPP